MNWVTERFSFIRAACKRADTRLQAAYFSEMHVTLPQVMSILRGIMQQTAIKVLKTSTWF